MGVESNDTRSPLHVHCCSSPCRFAVDAQVTSDRLLRRGAGAPELDHILRRLLRSTPQPADADHSGERQKPRAEVDPAQSGVWRLAVLTDRRRRDDVRHATSQRRPRRGRKDRPCVLAVPLHQLAGRARVLRRQQPWRCHSRRHALHGHARCAPRGDRQDDGTLPVGRRRR